MSSVEDIGIRDEEDENRDDRKRNSNGVRVLLVLRDNLKIMANFTSIWGNLWLLIIGPTKSKYVER